jgi:hypothetical protein
MEPLLSLLRAAGFGQLALVAVTPAIPYVLRWREETAKLRPLTRQVFWTYAGYILGAHFCFGLLSAAAPAWLLDRSPLAGCVAAFITAWWGVRLMLQFTCLDRSDAPPGLWIRLAETALVGLWIGLIAVYGCAAAADFGAFGS